MQRHEQEAYTTTPCLRCGHPCRVAAQSNPDARLLRAATTPTGVCASCHITAFLQDPGLPLGELLRERPVAETLRWPAFQQQMVRLVQAANADLPASHIDWERVIANWELPHPKRPRKARR